MGRGSSGRGGGSRGSYNPQSAARPESSATDQYGTLIRTYGDGTRSYARTETASSGSLDDEQRQWVRAMENVVRNDVRDALAAENVSTYDIDLDAGRVTAWVNVSRQASASGQARAYYDIDYTFDVTTNVRPDGTVRRYLRYRSLSLRLAGVNAY